MLEKSHFLLNNIISSKRVETGGNASQGVYITDGLYIGQNSSGNRHLRRTQEVQSLVLGTRMQISVRQSLLASFQFHQNKGCKAVKCE